jgi:glycosyltransferase involved in cell wall biosynthesis
VIAADPGAIAIDVVIDNYNYGRFLADAIASARAQTHPAVNLIVVDDGSTDDSRRVLEEQGEGLTVVLKENGGQASALNAGFERCQGDVVVFLDADDLLKPEAAARIAAAFAGDGPPARAQYRMDVIDGEGRPTGEQKPFAHLPMPSGDLRREELAYSFDLGWMPTSANAFRADALRRIAPIPEGEYRILADWYLVHLSTLLGPIVSIDEICASYRVHGENNFEHETAELNMDRLRNNIRLARPTEEGLARLADELGLERPPQIASVADLGNRMISLKLEPELHPIAGDSRRGLLRRAARAVPRRHDVSPAMRAMFAGWFTAMALAPRRLARQMALLFLFPERRSSVNRLFGRLHRG